MRLFHIKPRLDGKNRRKGAMFVFITITLIMLFAAAAFSTDIAYMFLTREQLRVSIDAAAKAAVVRLSQGDTQSVATQKAIDIAAANSVCGHPLAITASNVKIGAVAYGQSGMWVFNESGTPKTAAQVTAPAQVSLFFAPILGVNTFSPTSTSTAAFVRNKWCFVFDRSGSMCFDMTGTDWSYPPPVGHLNQSYPNSPRGPYVPDATLSRLANLNTGANTFLNALTNSPGGTSQNQVGMVTFATSSSLDCTFSSNYTPVTNKLTYYLTTNIYNDGIYNGGTNLHAGLQSAINLFTSTDDGTPWNKVIIVFSDGNWNDGTSSNQPSSSNPLNLVTAAKNADITIHTVGLLSNNTTMQQLAIQTGGQYFYVTNGADLQAAFQKLAQTIPVILTQ